MARSCREQGKRQRRCCEDQKECDQIRKRFRNRRRYNKPYTVTRKFRGRRKEK